MIQLLQILYQDLETKFRSHKLSKLQSFVPQSRKSIILISRHFYIEVYSFPFHAFWYVKAWSVYRYSNVPTLKKFIVALLLSKASEICNNSQFYLQC